MANALEDAVNDNWETVTDHKEGEYMAETEAKIVNRITADQTSGVQIELPIYAARNYRKRIGRKLADVFG